MRYFDWLTEQQREQLAAYVAMLLRYNRKFNLTGLTAEGDVWEVLIKTGLGFARAVEGRGTVLDIGSGNGIPGVVISIVNPSIRVTLIERRRKKAAFLQEVKYDLLPGLEVIAADVCELKKTGWDAIVGYKVAPLVKFLALVRHCAGPESVVIQRVGPSPVHEKGNNGEVIDNSGSLWYYNRDGDYVIARPGK